MAGTDGPILRSEAARRAQLVTARRRATALLAVVAVVFVALSALDHGGPLGYAQAAAEAGLVGGLADWFAVVALFRRPLGLPIPHTAVVVERKEQFAATLGSFVQESFLAPDLLVERAQAASVVDRIGAWMAVPANADRLATELLRAARRGADLVADDQLHDVLTGLLRERLERLDVAPLAGRALARVTAEGRHHDVLELGLHQLSSYLDTNRLVLRRRLGERSPWWLPGAVEDRLFERLVDGALTVLWAMSIDAEHPLRRDLDARLALLADDLQHSPELAERARRLVHDLMDETRLRGFVAQLWTEAKAELGAQAADEGSVLHARIAATIASAGGRLHDDPALRAAADRALETAIRSAAGRFDHEVADLISSTIERWDTTETARRLELLLGPDLQFIRINGTLVGALAGVALHAIAAAI